MPTAFNCTDKMPDDGQSNLEWIRYYLFDKGIKLREGLLS